MGDIVHLKGERKAKAASCQKAGNIPRAALLTFSAGSPSTSTCPPSSATAARRLATTLARSPLMRNALQVMAHAPKLAEVRGWQAEAKAAVARVTRPLVR